MASSTPQDFGLCHAAACRGQPVDVAFANAGTVDGTTRSLRVHYLMAGNAGAAAQPEMFFDAGPGLVAFDGVNAAPTTQDLLTANGALRGKWPKLRT